jgi:hypothetical protein
LDVSFTVSDTAGRNSTLASSLPACSITPDTGEQGPHRTTPQQPGDSKT